MRARRTHTHTSSLYPLLGVKGPQAMVDLDLENSVSAKGWKGPKRSYTQGLLERAGTRTL